MEYKSGHESVPLEGSELAKQVKDFEGYGEGLVRLSPGRWLFPASYQKIGDKLYDFKFKSKDVVVMTWPKCGTTWMQEIVWTMRNNRNFDHPDGDKHIFLRAPFLEMDMLLPKPKPGTPPVKNAFSEAFFKTCPGKNPADGIFLQFTEAIPEPRTIKTHLPFSLFAPSLLDTCKVVYVARNPKDVIVSYHHHSRIIRGHGYVGSFDDFVQYFVDDDLMFGPYWLHLKEAWERRDHPNFHLIFFEDLKANPLEEYRKLNDFLETGLSEDQLAAIVKYTSFSEMKARDSASTVNGELMEDAFNKEVIQKDGGFFRKGEAGDWKGKLNPEQNDKVDKWIQTHMSEFGIDFKYGH